MTNMDVYGRNFFIIPFLCCISNGYFSLWHHKDIWFV